MKHIRSQNSEFPSHIKYVLDSIYDIYSKLWDMQTHHIAFYSSHNLKDLYGNLLLLEFDISANEDIVTCTFNKSLNSVRAYSFRSTLSMGELNE